jgi:hypothetical protein
MYAEDVEFCYRARAANIEVALLADIRLPHLLGRSDGTGLMRDNPAWIINLYDFYCSAICRNNVAALCWRMVVGTGLLARSWLLDLVAAVRGARQSSPARVEAARMRRFALAIYGARGRP